MNDKDKEAFDKWFTQNPVNRFETEEAWQAACDYKHKELEQKLQDYEWDWIKMRDIADKMKAENAKLRECVEFYADKNNYVGRRSKSDIFSAIIGDNEITFDRLAFAGKKAREALKEITTN